MRDLSRQQATGRLLIRLPGTLASIYLARGDVVHAASGAHKGSEALSLILRTAPKSSEFRAGLSAPETTIEGPLESLLSASGGAPTASPEARVTQVPVAVPPPPTQEEVAARPSRSGEAVPAGFMSDLAKALTEIMGPIGSIILEDAQMDLGLGDSVPKDAVPSLLAEIAQQLKTPARQGSFQQRVKALLSRYNLD